ncbi:GNAT family N-acetyltransferase [Planococcus shixiaomingii]|uniref:GNAT family N-acetyltransferase n=1 Tax=Planococcus shixiaomingii TaxID=3058393 RepID=UPI0026294AAA|nr:GNAT family N-acetyltransferase [Planococcus sp. N022]WKA56554.1 GNAT family N-acetyltransferase [Planococcus sp. N022]
MLTTKQLYDLERLQKEVEANDDLELKLNWEMLRARDSNQHDFFHYENDELIAFIGLYSFGSTVEVTGMVKPGARRKGHFTKLFGEAMASANRLGYKKILLNAPAGSEAAKDFLKKQGASYAFSEHQMQWEPQPLSASTGFTLRQAESTDLDMRIRLDVEAFDIPLEDATAMESRVSGEQDTDMLMIDVNNETVGKIRIKREDGQAWIYGFSILPEHQGKGIGRKVLRHIVKQQSEAGYSVHLDVETKNAHALGLYKAIGFAVKHAQDYYVYEK